MVKMLYDVHKSGILPESSGIVLDGTLIGGNDDEWEGKYVWQLEPQQQIEQWKQIFIAYQNEKVMIRISAEAVTDGPQGDIPLSFDHLMCAMVSAAEMCGKEEVMILFPSGISRERFSCLIHVFDSAVADSAVLCYTGVEISDPHTALYIDQYAELADFIIFQTEELTKEMYCMAIGDARAAVCAYMSDGIFEQSPFCSFDEVGLGTLLLLAMCRANAANHNIKFGVEGKPVEEPQGRKFCSENGIGWMLVEQQAA